MNPLDVMLWALAGVVGIASLLFIVVVISLIVSVVRKALRKDSQANGNTFVFNGAGDSKRDAR